MLIHCFFVVWQHLESAMAACLALTELLGSAIQQLSALLCTGNSGELWGLPPVLGITATP